MVERQIVVLVVVGSSPVIHPTLLRPSRQSLHFGSCGRAIVLSVTANCHTVMDNLLQ